MHITEISVQASWTFPNPYEKYANFRPSVGLKATVDEGEDIYEAIRTLQARAEGMLVQHRHTILVIACEQHKEDQKREEEAYQEAQAARKRASENASLKAGIDAPEKDDLHF